MDLGQLRSFAEVAERGTVAAAAAALSFSPPAVSQHVAKLEAELGHQLFDRAGRRLTLTEAGHSLLPIALEMIDLEQRGRAAVAAPADRPHFVVAGFASAIATVLIPRLAAIAESMSIDIIESEDADALRDLRLGTVDVVLAQEYEDQAAQRDDRFEFTPLATDQLRLAFPSCFAPNSTIEDLADESWMINGLGTRCADATQRVLDAAGVRPRLSASVADNTTLLALVAAGHGVTVVPDLLLADPPAGVTVADQHLGLSRTIFAVHRRAAARAVAPVIEALTENRLTQ